MTTPQSYLRDTSTRALKPALTLGQGLPTKITVKIGDKEEEIPVSYWRGDAIACGKYRHPTTGQLLEVDEKRIDGWVEKFNAMRAANRKVPTPTTHFGDDANDNVGEVIQMQRNGDRLNLVKMVKGKRGAEIAAANSCSIKLDPDYVDEFGNHWGEAIVHSAFTPHPVITGMGSFVPFAASRDRQTETPIYYLSAEQGDPPMDLKALREALGAAADVPDDKLPDLAVQRLAALKTEGQTALSRATAAETKVRDLETVNLSRNPAKPSPTEIYWANKAVSGARDEAIKAGAITPAVADAAEARYLSKPVDRKTITLSRAVEDDDHKLTDGFAKLLDFYEVVKDNKPTPATGSQTGPQLLSREIPGASQQTIDQQMEAGRQQAAAYEKTLPARAN